MERGMSSSSEVGGGLGLFLLDLDLLPVAEDGVGIGRNGVGEDVRVAADELGAEIFGDVAEVEVAGFRGHLGVEEDLQEEVAEFVLEVGPGAALDGVEDLVGLFEGVALDGVEGLFAVPGAAAGGAQAGHDGGRALEGLGGRRLGLFPFDWLDWVGESMQSSLPESGGGGEGFNSA